MAGGKLGIDTGPRVGITVRAMKQQSVVRCLWVLAGIWQGLVPAGAMILFGLDNTANRTDPGTGVPFDAVGLVVGTGGADPMGSAIHLGGGYMLTANHVVMQPYVTFDGSTFYQRDTGFIPAQVAANVDLKVFRLTVTPTVGAVNLYSGASELAGSAATQVGWGVGRNPTIPVDSVAVGWGDYSTIDKRWGLNAPLDFPTIAYDSYSYGTIRTVLGSDSGSPAGVGESEAAATLIDSGAGLFQQIGGIWYLIGATTTVDTMWTSNFGNDAVTGTGTGDGNYFVRIGTYAPDLLALIPEPSVGMLFGGGVWWLLSRRRRGRH